MQLSTKGRYAVRAMLDLALNQKEAPISIGDISRRQEISSQYIEQLLYKLKKKGLVKSVRGSRGGYELARDPKDITAGDIIRVVEGPIDPVYCVNPEEFKKEECHRAELCATHVLWVTLGEKIAEVLDGTTLDDLCKVANELKAKYDLKST